MNSPQASPGALQTRPHFEILDGLRGLAAVAVVLFHFMEFVTPDYHDSFIAHGYLAVDFFFCLSGFVIAYAYDGRVRQLGTGRFFVLRLIRLHPLVLIGATLGLLTFVFDPFSALYAKYGPGQTLGLYASAATLVPWPNVRERYFNLFYLNAPTWSLCWEYLANVAYVLVLFRLPRRALTALLAVAVVVLGCTAYHYNNLAVGWGGENFWGGGGRIFYSFLAGMLIYRANWIIPSRLGFASLGVLLTAAFLVPWSDRVDWIVDPLIVLLYFPLLVALGAGATLRPAQRRVCVFSGDISYPLYMIHYPLLWVFLSYLETHKPTLRQMGSFVPVGTLALIGLAYVVLHTLDLPLRGWLRRRLVG